MEKQRAVGQPLQPEIKNQGEFRRGPSKKDPILHGGNSNDSRPEFLSLSKPPINPKHQSWNFQEKLFEKNAKLGFPILGAESVNRIILRPPNGRYFKPQYFNNRTTSYTKDSPTNRNGTIKTFDPTKTSVLNGYSCFVKEHHERAARATRKLLPRHQNYRDFERNSRDEYRQNFIRRENEMKKMMGAPLPMPSAIAYKVQRLQPVAPMGIYQWPRVRRWGCSSGGYAGTGV